MNVLLKKKVRFIGQSRQSCQARTVFLCGAILALAPREGGRGGAD